jgi:hypothetical protein
MHWVEELSSQLDLADWSQAIQRQELRRIPRIFLIQVWVKVFDLVRAVLLLSRLLDIPLSRLTSIVERVILAPAIHIAPPNLSTV